MPRPADETLDLHFPKAGLDLSQPFGRQPNRPAANGEYARTCAVGANVRVFSPSGSRSRGGSRCGLSKWINARVARVYWVIQELSVLSSTAYDAPGVETMPQSSQSGRVVTLVAVSQGSVFVANPGDTAWTAATNATGESPALNSSGIMFSAQNVQKLFFADGINWCYYDPLTNTVYPWVATAGTLPVDDDNNTPRLICTWRGRTVLSGILGDPSNVFMSRVSDPFDFDYGARPFEASVAWAGNFAPQGLPPDSVTCLIPYSDDVLIVGCDHSIYMFRGDPNGGGQIDHVTDAIGMAFGQPWCRDPEGVVYFFSNRTGIFAMTPGQAPLRVSQAIDPLLQEVDTGLNSIRLLWDDRFQGFHVWVTPLLAPEAATHYYFERRSGSWWTDTFVNHDHDPLCCCVLDGNEPGDRVPIIGCWDGYVRKIDRDAETDDGFDIESDVWVGPLVTANADELLVQELQGILGESSGEVSYEVYAGRTAEEALASAAVDSGTLAAGRNDTEAVKVAGHALYLRLFGTSRWAMEQVRLVLKGRGKVRRRGK